MIEFYNQLYLVVYIAFKSLDFLSFNFSYKINILFTQFFSVLCNRITVCHLQ